MIGEENGHEINIPVRVVMNNKTFTAFSGFKFEDMRKSFELTKTTISMSNKRKNCFTLLQNELNKAVFCDFSLDSSKAYYAEWDYDFNLFKYQCFTKTDKVNTTFTHEIEEELRKKKVNLVI